MKTIISAVISVLLMAGCASTSRSTGQLMKLSAEKVIEVDFTASVSAAVAYGNILSKAQKCWNGSHRVVVIEATPFDADDGYARIAVRTPGEILIPRMMITVIEIFPDGENIVRLTGRSLRSKIRNFNPAADLPHLKQWAEGNAAPCNQQQAQQQAR
jgi:hypothetical protein